MTGCHLCRQLCRITGAPISICLEPKFCLCMVLSEVVCTLTIPSQLFGFSQWDCGPLCHYVHGYKYAYKYGSVAKKISDANIRYMNTRCGVRSTATNNRMCSSGIVRAPTQWPQQTICWQIWRARGGWTPGGPAGTSLSHLELCYFASIVYSASSLFKTLTVVLPSIPYCLLCLMGS